MWRMRWREEREKEMKRSWKKASVMREWVKERKRRDEEIRQRAGKGVKATQTGRRDNVNRKRWQKRG